MLWEEKENKRMADWKNDMNIELQVFDKGSEADIHVG